MNVAEKIAYWVDTAEYDLETADAMLRTKRYLYVGFMCHQAVEKMLKADFWAKQKDMPPYIHHLKRLAEGSGILSNLSDEQLDLIEELIPMNIEGRYPSYKDSLFKSLSQSRCENIILKTKMLCSWIKAQF